MKIPPLLSRILLSSWVLAIIPAVVLIALLPPVSSRYEIDSYTRREPDQLTVYADLNGDRVTERLIGANQDPYTRIIVQDNDEHFYDQLNYTDSLTPGISEPFFGDFDHDNLGEMYLFLTSRDSVFLYVNEFFDEDGTHYDRIFITTVGLVTGKIITNSLQRCGFFDRNGDGADEVYFKIASGFGLYPRAVYCYDLAARKLSTSKFTGVNLNYPDMADLDGDGRPEITGVTTASGNYHTPTPFSDYSAWLMVYDDSLNFKFPPEEFKGFGNAVDAYAFKGADHSKLFVAHGYFGADTTLRKPSLMFYTADGKRLTERFINDIDPGFAYFKSFVLRNHTPNRILLLTDQRVLILDENLEVIHNTAERFPPRSAMEWFDGDVTGDGVNEYFIYFPQKRMMRIYSADLTVYGEMPIYFDPNKPLSFSAFRDKENGNRLFVKKGDEGFYIRIKEHPYFFLSYLIYPGVYLPFVGFIVFIRRVNTSQVTKREQLKQRVLTLQLRTIKSQLDPHFTFNALNSVSSLIYQGSRDEAYDSVTRFSQLLRQMVNDADRVYRTLQEEIQFVTQYLELEKLRFGQRLRYEITVDPGVNLLQLVPTMMIQTFVENSVKHGLSPKQEGGTVNVKLHQEGALLHIVVEDDGIGREQSAGKSTSTGKGLKMTEEFYEVLNQLSPGAIELDISDRNESNGVDTGTRVNIVLRGTPDRKVVTK